MKNKNRTKIVHLKCTIRRGGSERQLFTIYKYSPQNIINKIVSIYKPKNSYQEEYHVPQEDIHFLLHTNNFIRTWRFYKIAHKENPDIVYAWDTLSFLIAKIAGIFLSYQTINGSIRHGIRSPELSQYWRTFILHLSKYVVANSYAGLKANNLHRGFVLYNGIKDSFFKSSAKPNHLALSSGISLAKPVLISVANLIPYKDYLTVLNALVLLKENGRKFSYLIIGEGPDRKTIEKQIETSGLHNCVFLLGAKSNVAEYLNIADLFIHSSRGEGCPNAVLEAMASGLPVIATDTGGTSEIVEDDFGRLFPYKNIRILYTLISELAFDQAKITEMGKNAKATARRKYGVDRMIDNYQVIIKQVASKK